MHVPLLDVHVQNSETRLFCSCADWLVVFPTLGTPNTGFLMMGVRLNGMSNRTNSALTVGCV